MSFSYELNEDTDYSKELLDMNSELVKGRLSVEKDSNQLHLYLMLPFLKSTLNGEKTYVNLSLF